jgi:hypothetical protein
VLVYLRLNPSKQRPKRLKQYANWCEVPVTLFYKYSHQFVAPFVCDLLFAISKAGLLHVVNVMANLVIQGLTYSVHFEERDQQKYLRVRFKYSIHDQPNSAIAV